MRQRGPRIGAPGRVINATGRASTIHVGLRRSSLILKHSQANSADGSEIKTFVTGRDLSEWGLCDFGTIDCPIRVRHIHGGLHLKAKISCGVTPRLRHGALTLF